MGLGAQWEIWALALGGMSPVEALQSVTLTDAEAIGIEKDLSSIAPSQFSDLQALDLNPLENIRYTKSVHWVIKNGRLYEAGTPDEFPDARLC